MSRTPDRRTYTNQNAMKNLTRYALLLMGASGAACFAFFQYAYPYHLIHREQMLLFTYTTGQIQEYFSRPAFLSCLGGDFLTQFFHYQGWGAAIVGIVMALTGLLTYFTCRKWINEWGAIATSVIVLVWESMRFCDINYPLSGALSLAGALSLFLLTDKLKGKWDFTIGSLCEMVLCYWLFGYGIFVFTLLTLVSALTRRKKKNYIGACLMVILSLAIPAVAANKYLMILPQAYTYPATAWYGAPDLENERILGLNTEDYFENWNKINELVWQGAPTSATAACYNLANAMQGRLPEQLMNYYQPAALGLFMPVNAQSTYLSTQLAGEIWFRLGDMTMAEHATILSMIFSPGNKNARMVQRLAEINLINGDDEAARKYLHILSKTLAYRQWAQDRIPGKESEEVKKWLQRKRTCLPQKDTLRLSSTDISKSLHLLLEANPNNQMALDYLLCFDLLMKDLPTFLKDYEQYYRHTPNRLYAEALLIYLYQKRATGEEVKAKGINPAIIREFNEYNHLYAQSQGNASVLENRFGRTYWYYYKFTQFQ